MYESLPGVPDGEELSAIITTLGFPSPPQIRSGRGKLLRGALGSLGDPFWGLEESFSVWLQRECGFLGTKP